MNLAWKARWWFGAGIEAGDDDFEFLFGQTLVLPEYTPTILTWSRSTFAALDMTVMTWRCEGGFRVRVRDEHSWGCG